MRPASVMKVLTSFAALSELGPDFTFKTQIRTTGKQNGTTLSGPIYLVGGGDPLFVSERMWLFANTIKRLGIKKFTGPLYLDKSLFAEAESIDERKIDDAVNRAYNAILSPLAFNFNTTTIVVQPSIDKKSALVSIDPPNDFVKITNEVKIVSGDRRFLKVTYVGGTEGGEHYKITGTIGANSEEKKLYRNIRFPAYYFARILKYQLQETGVEFPSDIKLGVAPKNSKLITEFESLPLSQIIDGLNKYSNNFVADQILLTLASSKNGSPTTLKGGTAYILKSLKTIGINTTGMILENGSGLSREVRLTPNQVTSVLLHAQKNLNWGPYFVSSFSTSGVDGTLKSRLNGNFYGGKVKGKTGTLRGVVGLAGYVRASNGKILAVTSFINDPKNKNADLIPYQDLLFKWMVDWGK